MRHIAYHMVVRLPSHIEVDDLIQAGMVGLLEAARHFSSGHGASFETYARSRIRGAMLDTLRKLDWAPRSVRRKARVASTAMVEVRLRAGAQASDSAIAAHMGVSIEAYRHIVQDALGSQLLSLDDSDDDESSILHRMAHSGFDPQSSLLSDARREAILVAISELPERERLVISLYYEQEMNLKQIGVVIKVTESRVCQIHSQALQLLKNLLIEWQT